MPHYKSDWVDLEAVERYSALNPRGTATPRCRRSPQSRRGRRRLRHFGQDIPHARHRQPLRAGRVELLPLRARRADPVPGRRGPGLPQQPDDASDLASANEITAAICTTTGQRPAPSATPGASWPPTPRCGSPGPADPGLPGYPRPVRVVRGSGRRRQLARRSRTILRSTSFRPPHMPCGSRIRMAYSRHSPCT